MSGPDDGSAVAASGETERRVSPFRLVTVLGGAGLVGSYVLPWVAVADGNDISARELELLPELAVAIGVLAVVIAALRWTTRAQVVMLVSGLAGTGLSLFVWFFLDNDADIIEVGGQAGPPGSFGPGPGLFVALAGSALLLGAGFLALLRGFDR